jgi:predicted MPP superfamily phosphohydrolase
MPNTSKGFPYTVAIDDPNIPADIQALAQAIDTQLNNYSQTTHTHTGVYATSAHNHDGTYSLSAHVHSNYLTSADLTGYSQTTHNHDSSYATTGHTHSTFISTSLISSTKGSMPVGTGTGVSTITPGAND